MFKRRHETGFVIDADDEGAYIAGPTRQPMHEFIPKSSVARLTCIFFVFVGLVPMEVGRTRVYAYKKEFGFRKQKYIVNGQKVCQIKPWHFAFTRNYFNFCFYRVGIPEPMSVYKPSFQQDADSLDRVTNDQNIRSLLPNPSKMLTMITLVALLIAGGSMMLAFYLLADTEGSENIRNLVTNARPTTTPPAPIPGIPGPGQSPPPPVVINPTET